MKRIASLAAAAALTLASAATHAAWPEKPIRMIVPLAAGSAVDVAARIVMQKVSTTLGQSIVVDNQPGASGLIGAEQVARAAPDGYTIGGFNDSILTMIPHVYPKMPWNPLTDFAPISLVATVEWGLVVKPDSPYRTAADFIAAAKAAPGKLTYGSGGNGSPQHIAMALFASRAGLQLQHVPYKGATPAAMAVAAGEVDAAYQGLGTVTALIQGGKLRLAGVTTPKRMDTYAAVPTVSESGLADFQFNSWFAMVAPAGTPPAIVERINAEVRKALQDPGVRDQMTRAGLTLRGSSPQELGQATKAQFELYGKLIRDHGIKAE